MRFVFFGSFKVSAEILKGLVRHGLSPLAVVCNPDRPAGKKKIVTAPAVKQLITKNKWQMEILQPESVSEINDQLSAMDADFFLVMGYPQIIPKEILTIPRLGTIGVHPSLLPKYRGASPMQSVLLNGEKETGVTLYLIDEKMDHGPVLSQRSSPIPSDETNANLEQRMASLAVDLLVETLPAFGAGKITPQEQDHTQATFTKKFTTADAQVDMQNDSPLAIYRKIQAFTPEPGVWTMNLKGYEGKRVKLLRAKYENDKLILAEIQVEGKKPVSL